MTNPTFHVRILSPQKLYLDTDCVSISSENLKGKFDILASHANFITTVENHPIVVRLESEKPFVFKFPIAIIMARENRVDIFTYVQPQTGQIS